MRGIGFQTTDRGDGPAHRGRRDTARTELFWMAAATLASSAAGGVIDPIHATGFGVFIAVLGAGVFSWRRWSELRQEVEWRKRAEALLRAGLDNSPSLVYAVDHAGRFVLANRRLESTFSLRERDVLGRTPAECLPLAPGDTFASADGAAYAGESAIQVEETAHVAGEKRTYDSTKFVLRGEASQPYAVCTISNDVTARRRAEEALLQAQKMEGIGRLAGGVAHDFNNILAVIVGQSELLYGCLDQDSKTARRVEEIRKAAARGASLTRQLLAFSRKQLLEPKVVGLHGVVQEIEEMLRRLIGEHIQLVVRHGRSDVPVCVDATQLQQVLMNLIVNARDAMPNGGTLVLETAAVDLDDEYVRRQPDARPGPHALLLVSDTGSGIEPAQLSRIFEPFFTTKPEGEGTGLGLATVYGIVKQSGGHVGVESACGHGTTFKVYLPRAGGAPAPAAALASDRAQGLGGAETILYVEDDPALRQLGTDLLREGGYTVLNAGDAEEALAIAARDARRIDVLVADVVLPTMNGHELWQRLEAERPGLPVVYVTGYTGDSLLSRILGEKARVVEKPFGYEALLQAVRTALQERPEQRLPQRVKTREAGGLGPALARAILLAACGFFTPSADAAPAVAPSQATRPWQLAGSWSQSQGLPQDRVYTILQASDGYLWLGTRGGVTRFDGVRFTTFDDRGSQAIRDNEVWALAEDKGGLWIGTYGGGLTRFEGGRITTYTRRDGLVDDFVRVLARDASGALWIGTDGGLSRLQDGRFQGFTVADGLAHGVVKALCVDPEGSVWVATQPARGGGLHRVKNGRVEPVALPGLEKTPLIEDVRRSADGAIWLATLDGLLRWADGAVTRYTVSDGLSSDRIRALHEDARGLWIATDRGVDMRPRGADLFQAVVRNGAVTDLSALLTDREGNLWVGTRARGVARFDRGLFDSYTTADGLPSPDVATVLEDRHGTLWVGAGRGLSALGATGFRTVASGLTDEPIGSLAEDRDGHLWVGTESGVFRSTRPLECAGCKVAFERVAGVPATKIRTIHPDRRGGVWMGADSEGLFRHDGKRLVWFGAKEGLSHGAVRAVAETGDGGLWIGTKGGGLNRLRDGRFTVYTTKDGLPSDSVQALHVDAAGALWIATRRGLSRFKDGRFATIGAADGLFASHVYGLVEDLHGNMWMTCGRGVFRVRKQELDAFAEGRVQSVFSVAYGREHGLAATMAAVGHDPVVFRAKDGRVFFALSGGLAMLDPRALSFNRFPPPVQLEELTVDGRGFDVLGRASAPPGRGDLMLRYTALSFVAPEKVRFRYRLEGFDPDWVEAGTRRAAYYTNVPPGLYRFTVIASNHDGVWNEKGAAVELSLGTRFYRTSWFYAASLLAIVITAAAAHRYRLRSLEARERELSVRVEEAVAQLRTLKGLLPICSSCKSIRDDEGYWNQMEAYIRDRSEAEFSHGICPDCAERLYPRHAHLAIGHRRRA